jgi:hypothetical protein
VLNKADDPARIAEDLISREIYMEKFDRAQFQKCSNALLRTIEAVAAEYPTTWLHRKFAVSFPQDWHAVKAAIGDYEFHPSIRKIHRTGTEYVAAQVSPYDIQRLAGIDRIELLDTRDPKVLAQLQGGTILKFNGVVSRAMTTAIPLAQAAGPR